MFLLRGVFWLSLVAALVPYSAIDMSKATFTVDGAALKAQLAALPHFCRTNRAICDRTETLAATAGKESAALVRYIGAQIERHR